MPVYLLTPTHEINKDKGTYILDYDGKKIKDITFYKIPKNVEEKKLCCWFISGVARQ